MNNLFALLSLIGFLGSITCLIISIKRFFKRLPAKKTLKSSGILAVIFIFSFIGFGITIPKQEQSSKSVLSSGMEKTIVSTTEVTTEFITEEMTTPSQSPQEKFVDILTRNQNVTAEAAEQAYGVLTEDLGFQNVSAKENNDVTIFEIRADDYILSITVSDKLYMVICGDYNLYKDDTITYTKQDLEDRKIGNNDTIYYTIAKEAVSQNLKSPSSAKFCSLNECQMARKGDYVAVKGYVDAINSFNAELRNEFVVEFRVIDLSSFSYETVYININGETTGTYIDLK